MKTKKLKLCKTCTRREKVEWTLAEAEAAHHLERYPEHVIVDEFETKEKRKK